MPQALELARIRVETTHEQDFINKREAAIAAVKEEIPGFVHGYLSRLEDNVWLDAITWESKELALAAADKVVGLPAFADWAQHITEVIAFEHAEIVHEA